MNKIKIITDSACDLEVETLRKLNVDFVPASVIVDGIKYQQNINITTDELYRMLIEEKKTISTAAPAPGEFHRVFKKAFDEEGVDTVIFLSLHGKLSAIYQTALMVAKQFFSDKDITVIDTKTVSLTEALIVQEAANMVIEGKSKEDIIERCSYLANYTVALPLLDTLEYIYRGGRIKLYQKLLGNFLGVKALVLINPNGSTIGGKVRGRKNAMIQIKMCGLQIQDHLKLNRMYVAYTTNRALAEEVASFLIENGRKEVEVLIGQLGPVVGAHGGNDVVGYGFIGHFDSKMFSGVGDYTITPKKEEFIQKVKG